MMLQNIKLPTAPTAKSTTPSELLLACHQRIRHFSDVAVKLAHAHGVTETEIVQAATGLHRYFSVALPLHEADENLSLHPRLRRAVPAEELAGPAADAMLDQHLAIDELVERLVPLWLLLQSAPEKLPETAGEMRPLVTPQRNLPGTPETRRRNHLSGDGQISFAKRTRRYCSRNAGAPRTRFVAPALRSVFCAVMELFVRKGLLPAIER